MRRAKFHCNDLLAVLILVPTYFALQHGEELSGSVTITSLEENFLHELADFTNETEFRQVVAQVNASTGRARFVARCGCSLIFNCDSQGIVYADVNLTLNESPKVAEIKVRKKMLHLLGHSNVARNIGGN